MDHIAKDFTVPQWCSNISASSLSLVVLYSGQLFTCPRSRKDTQRKFQPPAVNAQEVKSGRVSLEKSATGISIKG